MTGTGASGEAGAAASPASLSRERRAHRREAVFRRTVPLYLMIAPVLLYFLLFTYIPTVYGFLISFQKYSLVGKSTWIGLANYVEVFTTPGFWNAFFNTLILGFGDLAISTPIVILVALLLNEFSRSGWKKFVQTTIFIPHLFGWVVIVGIWIYILAPDYGALNVLLRSLGREPINFLTNPSLAKPLVIFLDVWKEAGFLAILYLAAITQINPEIYEAAVIDGAGRLRQALSITLPSLGPTVKTLVLLGVTGVFNIFDPVYVLRNAGNSDALDVIMYYIKHWGLDRFRMGYTSAISVFVFILVLTVTLSTKQAVKYRI